jgi:protein-tyrosine phosphatase
VRIVCGAEVKYYPGIGRMEDLHKLALEGTNLLLLEMPMTKWTDFTVKELTELANMGTVRVVMAHIERYIGMQSKRVLERLCDSGVLMQVNASFFERVTSRHKALKLLASGYVHFVGSDCHNMTSKS